MNRGLTITLTLLGFASAAWAQEARAVISPQVTSDRHVTFRLTAPDAHAVTVSGEFMSGSQNLVKQPDGVWSVTVGPIEPETYHYNFTIDGVRTIDPLNPQVKTGSTASTLTSVLEVRGDHPFFYDPRPVPHGDIRSHWYESKSLGTTRRLTVYTPPGYDRDANSRYPVLYLFHGANADETAWVKLGRVNLIIDNLLGAGQIKPFLIVMPFGYGVSPNAPGLRDNTAKFGADLFGDVIPFIDAHYRTLADRDHRAIVGLSMGGGESLSIGLNHLELFSYVGGFSAAIGSPAEFPNTYGAIAAGPETANKKLHLLWIGCGTEDSLFPTSKAFSDFLDARKITHTFRQTSGAHTWMVWRRYLNEISPLLFK
jgi:enterochelin esterase-like enzyme